MSLAHENHFNGRYKEYLKRVKEVNKAKSMLRINRDQMSYEVKKQMALHIKRKM